METLSLRIAIVDPRRLVRDGFAAYVREQAHVEIAASADAAPKMIRACQQGRPCDVALVALALGTDSLVTIVEYLRTRDDRPGLVVLRGAHEIVADAVTNYRPLSLVDDRVDFDRLLIECRRARRGSAPPKLIDLRGNDPYPERLTGRQLDVLRLIARGDTTRQISGTLGISPKTVESHTQRLFIRLDVQNRAHAVAIAARDGLIHDDMAV